MRIFILLFMLSWLVVLTGRAQYVSLSEKNASIEKIFIQIEKQTDFVFFYNDSLIHRAKNITIEVKNKPLAQVLELCFKEQPFTYIIVNKSITLKLKRKGMEKIPGDTQLISIDIDNGEVMDAIKIVKAQYPIGYSIDPELLNGAKKVTIHLKNALLQDVLETICKDQLFYFVFENRMLYSKRGNQPDRNLY